MGGLAIKLRYRALNHHPGIGQTKVDLSLDSSEPEAVAVGFCLCMLYKMMHS